MKTFVVIDFFNINKSYKRIITTLKNRHKKESKTIGI